MDCLADCAVAIEVSSVLLIETLKQGGKIIFCGNGGSAADCQHIAAELVVQYQKNRQALAALALTTDTSILTA
ncbi:MAG: SIS domain-containing protein, partial [Methylococcales bacterium]